MFNDGFVAVYEPFAFFHIRRSFANFQYGFIFQTCKRQDCFALFILEFSRGLLKGGIQNFDLK